MITLLQGDCIELMKTLPDGVAQMCVTSPPYYGLRDYGIDGQMGLENTPDCLGWATGNACGVCYVCRMVAVFHEVRRILKDDGVLFLNIGDSYASFRDGKAVPDTARGSSMGTYIAKGGAKNRMASTFSGTFIKHKDIMAIPWRVGLALQADGWYLRQDNIWNKPNPRPESVGDRCTKAHEYIFLLSKSEQYFWNAKAMQEIGAGGATRNKRSVWTVATKPYRGAHFAVFPPEIPHICIGAGSRPGDTVIDPFNGSGTTGQEALRLGRNYIGIELNPQYFALAHKRLAEGRTDV